MSSVAASSLSKTTHDELCCTYAALILHDEKLEITGNQIKKLIEASKNKVDPYWPNLFAKALQGKNVGELLLGGGAAATTGGATSGKTEAKKEAKVEAKKEAPKVEEKPAEEEVDMGGLFDF